MVMIFFFMSTGQRNRMRWRYSGVPAAGLSRILDLAPQQGELCSPRQSLEAFWPLASSKCSWLSSCAPPCAFERFFFFYPGSIRHRKQKSSVRLSYSLKLLAASCRPVSSGQVITCLRKHKMPKCPWDVGKNMSKVQRFIFNVLSNFCCCFFIPGICYTFWKLSVDCTHGW